MEITVGIGLDPISEPFSPPPLQLTHRPPGSIYGVPTITGGLLQQLSRFFFIHEKASTTTACVRQIRMFFSRTVKSMRYP